MPESYCTIRGCVLLFRLVMPYMRLMVFGSQAIGWSGWSCRSIVADRAEF
jgi:hypothetical protein